MREICLGINVDHVATIRQARGTSYPDPLEAALAAERGGAGGITVHLREDRRHIQEEDVLRLKAAIRTKLNLEMAATEEIVAFACRLRPHDACLVPEKREELTTEGGLAVDENQAQLGPVVARLNAAGIRVSLFIDPEPVEIEAARALQAAAVELHTGGYANAQGAAELRRELERIRAGAQLAGEAGLTVHGGHGLTLENVGPVAAIAEIVELNIGHSIISRALFVGMEQAVREMRSACSQSRAAHTD